MDSPASLRLSIPVPKSKTRPTLESALALPMPLRERPWSKFMGKNKDRGANCRDRRFDRTAAQPVFRTGPVLAIGSSDLDFGGRLSPSRKI